MLWLVTVMLVACVLGASEEGVVGVAMSGFLLWLLKSLVLDMLQIVREKGPAWIMALLAGISLSMLILIPTVLLLEPAILAAARSTPIIEQVKWQFNPEIGSNIHTYQAAAPTITPPIVPTPTPECYTDTNYYTSWFEENKLEWEPMDIGILAGACEQWYWPPWCDYENLKPGHYSQLRIAPVNDSLIQHEVGGFCGGWGNPYDYVAEFRLNGELQRGWFDENAEGLRIRSYDKDPKPLWVYRQIRKQRTN